MSRNGSLSYLHIPALDLRRSAEFHADVFGWAVQGADGPGPGSSTPVASWAAPG